MVEKKRGKEETKKKNFKRETMTVSTIDAWRERRYLNFFYHFIFTIKKYSRKQILGFREGGTVTIECHKHSCSCGHCVTTKMLILNES